MKCPKAIRRAVWLHYIGKKWESKCNISWCLNKIDILGTWHVGHDIPKSKGGTLNLNNLRPICSDCNAGMGNRYTIKEWDDTYAFKSPKELEACQILLSFKNNTIVNK